MLSPPFIAEEEAAVHARRKKRGVARRIAEREEMSPNRD